MEPNGAKSARRAIDCRNQVEHFTVVVVPYSHEQGERSWNRAGIRWSRQVDDVRVHFCLHSVLVDINIDFLDAQLTDI